MSDAANLITAIVSIIFLLIALWERKHRIEAVKDKEAAQENEQDAKETVKEMEAELIQAEQRAAVEPPRPPEVIEPSLEDQLEEHVRRECGSVKPEKRWTWKTPRGPVPVYVKRTGSSNHRCILPDGTTPLIPITELLPPEPPKEEPKPGRFSWLFRPPFERRYAGR